MNVIKFMTGSEILYFVLLVVASIGNTVGMNANTEEWSRRGYSLAISLILIIIAWFNPF